MYFFLEIFCLFFTVWLVYWVWRWPNHESHFYFWPEEKILLPCIRVRRRVYYWGRFELRIMEEKIDIWITTHRILFGHRPWITQMVYFEERPARFTFRGPSFFCKRSQIQCIPTSDEEFFLKIPFRSLERDAYFEIFDLPENVLFLDKNLFPK